MTRQIVVLEFRTVRDYLFFCNKHKINEHGYSECDEFEVVYED